VLPSGSGRSVVVVSSLDNILFSLSLELRIIQIYLGNILFSADHNDDDTSSVHSGK
jgi:hypothetical protein